MANDFTQNTSIKAKPKVKPYELRDGKVRGLILRVQPTGKKAWVCELRNYKGKKRRATIKVNGMTDANVITLTQARHLANAIIAHPEKYFLDAPLKSADNTKVFGDFFKGAYKEYAEANMRSHNKVLPSIKRNFSHLFDRDMDKIAETDIVRWQKNKTVAFTTLQRDFTNLKACLNRAVDTYHLINSHQLERYNIKRPRNDPAGAEQKDPRYLLEGEEERLREALSARDCRMQAERRSANQWRKERGYQPKPELSGYADHITPLVLLAVNTGLRRGDLFDLEWRHVNFQLRHIRKVINKISHTMFGKAPKTIPLSDEAYAVLDKWRQQTEGEGRVFPSNKSGGRLDNIDKAWHKLLEGAEIEDFRFHDLRHTFASKLVMGGVDLNTVRELMCHSDIKMTLVYAHLSPGHMEKAISQVFNQKS